MALPDVTGLDVEDAKQALRSVARDVRKRRSAAAREELGAQWVSTALDFIGEARTVACYVAVNNEPPTLKLCEAIANKGMRSTLAQTWPGPFPGMGVVSGRGGYESQRPRSATRAIR